jgi:phosphohistidine phosphatase
MSSLFASQYIKPDLIVSSPSVRTTKTVNAFATAWNYKKKNIIREQSLYEASVDDILGCIERTDEAVQSLLIV